MDIPIRVILYIVIFILVLSFLAVVVYPAIKEGGLSAGELIHKIW